MRFIFERYLLITHKISISLASILVKANFRDFAGHSQKLHGLINVCKDDKSNEYIQIDVLILKAETFTKTALPCTGLINVFSRDESNKVFKRMV